MRKLEWMGWYWYRIEDIQTGWGCIWDMGHEDIWGWLFILSYLRLRYVAWFLECALWRVNDMYLFWLFLSYFFSCMVEFLWDVMTYDGPIWNWSQLLRLRGSMFWCFIRRISLSSDGRRVMKHVKWNSRCNVFFAVLTGAWCMYLKGSHYAVHTPHSVVQYHRWIPGNFWRNTWPFGTALTIDDDIVL